MSFFAPKMNTTQRAEKIDTFQATKCDFGTPLPIAYGTCKLGPNVINWQDFEAQERKTVTKTGKKSKSTTYDYAYYVYTELALCEGPIEGIGKLDVGSNNYNSLAELNADNNKEGSGLALCLGDNAEPTDYMATKHPDIAVGYKDMAYLFGTVYLGLNSASMPSYSIEVHGKLRESGDGVDANPADVIIDLLGYVGLADYVDQESFNNFRKYCKQADLLISTHSEAFSNQRKCADVISELLKLLNCYMFWSVDRFKIVVRDDRQRGTWIPNRQVLYALTEDDFIKSAGACVTFSRKDSSERYNRFGVSFVNRNNAYEKETVFFEDVESIKKEGIKAASTVEAAWFHSKERAVKIAEMLARTNKVENTKYTFKLDWSYNLEPGDLVSLTDSAIGLENQVAMVESVTEDARGNLTITAIRRADGIYKAPAYNIHEHDYNSVSFNIDPYNTAPPLFIQPPEEMVTSSTGVELWVALHGEQPTWGGCGVLVSDQDGNYTQQGTHAQSSVFGYTITAMTAESDSVTIRATNPNMVEILSGSEWDADRDNTLVWIDGEFISYTAAELVGENTYMLSGVLRGRFDTEAVEHPANTNAALCDGDLYVLEIPRHYANRLLYLKFPAFNYFGQNWQNPNDLPYYNAKSIGVAKPPSNVLTLDTELLSNGVRRFWWNYDYGTAKDTAGFEIRYIQGNYPSWENGIQLHTGLLTAQPFETDAIRQGVHTIMIKAIDKAGNESEQPAFAVLNLGDPLEDNVLYKRRLSENGWAGVSHSGIIKDGMIIQKDISDFWSKPNDIFWKAPELPFWNGLFDELHVTWQDVATASGQLWFRYDVEGSFRLEYRVVDNPIPIDQEDAKALWKPYTCKVDVKAGDIIQARAFTGVSGEETRIHDIVMIIDVVDREEHFENIAISAEGVILPITTPNYYTTAVRVDAVSSEIYGSYEMVIVNYNPCTIRFETVSNDAFQTRTPIAVTADITWQGFIKEVLDNDTN